MQYVLTEAEMKKLVPAEEHEKLKQAIEWMRKKIVADRCIHTEPSMEYCDMCPLGALDDSGPPRHLRTVVCRHHHSYSK